MEPVGAFLAEDLGWLNRMFSGEESDFMTNVHGHNEPSDTFNYSSSSTFWPTDEANMNVDGLNESLFLSSHTLGTNYFSEETSYSSGSNSACFSTVGENHFATGINHLHESFNIPEPMNFCAMDSGNNFAFPHFPENFMEEFLGVKEEITNEKIGNADSQPASFADTGKEMQLKRKLDSSQSFVGEDEQNDLPKAPKKKARVARNAQKGKKNTVLKKNQKLNKNVDDEEETNTVTNVESSSSCGSDNDSNEGATSDSKGPTNLNSNRKTRASRGAATDPQSLYARKRRERINERLRILQNIVPNGTKVDMSTMLEEAVQYVKFLQLQIKLLSSDEMWMYAPLAYNGMDMGLYHKISQRAL